MKHAAPVGRIFLSHVFVNRVRAFAVVSVTALVIVDGSLGAALLASRSRGRDLTAHVSELQNEISSTSKAVTALAKGGELPESSTSSAVGVRLKNQIDSVSLACGSEAAAFTEPDDPTPYVSQFVKVSNESGWNQQAITLTLNGSAPSIFRTLDHFLKPVVPTEFDALEMTVLNRDEHGIARVRTDLNLRVLSQAGSN